MTWIKLTSWLLTLIVISLVAYKNQQGNLLVFLQMSSLPRPLLAIPSGCNFFSPLLLAPSVTHPNLTYLVSLSSVASSVTGPFMIFSEGPKFSLLSAGIGFDPSYTINHFHLMPSFFYSSVQHFLSLSHAVPAAGIERGIIGPSPEGTNCMETWTSVCLTSCAQLSHGIAPWRTRNTIALNE